MSNPRQPWSDLSRIGDAGSTANGDEPGGKVVVLGVKGVQDFPCSMGLTESGDVEEDLKH